MFGDQDGDEAVDSFFDAADAVLDKSRADEMFYSVLRQLPDDQADFVYRELLDHCYRSVGEGPDGEFVIVPFAIPFVIFTGEDAKAISSAPSIDKTLAWLTDEKGLLTSTGITGATLIIDQRARIIASYDWNSFRASYILSQSYAMFAQGLTKDIPPYAMHIDAGAPLRSAGGIKFFAVLGCAIIALDDSPQEEAMLFNRAGDEYVPRTEFQCKLGEVLEEDCRRHFGSELVVSAMGEPIELYKVTDAVHSYVVSAVVTFGLLGIEDKLLAAIQDKAPFSSLYAGLYTDKKIVQMRLAAYTPGDSKPFFTHIFDICGWEQRESLPAAMDRAEERLKEIAAATNLTLNLDAGVSDFWECTDCGSLYFPSPTPEIHQHH